MNARKIISILSLTIPLIVTYQSCQKLDETHESISSASRFSAPEGLPSINYLIEPPPHLICGKSGWGYMMRNYVKLHCGACHYQGAFAPIAFADKDLDMAYSQASWISREQWIRTTTQNRFCVPNCNIVSTGEVQQALVEWADNKNCP